MTITIKKMQWETHEIWHEGGPQASEPRRVATIAAVIDNPFAGDYHADIADFMEDLKPLGLQMSERLLASFGVDRERVDGYGKGAIVGEDGELEHCALWHVPGGYAMREAMPNSAAIVPSCKSVAAAGAHLAIPITHSNASYVRSHFDAVEVRVPGAPLAGEMVVILAMSCGPRIHARVGGLDAADVKGEDGLR